MSKEELILWNEYPCGANEQIYSHLTKKYLKGRIGKDGYKVVKLKCVDGKRRLFLWHRVIYTYFYGTIPEGYEINHLDENKQNNRLSNLECISHLENIRYGTAIERRVEKRYKPVVAVDMDDNVVYEFASMREAEQYGFHHSAVGECCRNCFHKQGNNIYKNLRWYYLEDWLKIIKGVA